MKKKLFFITCFLFGIMMINAGLDKLFHYMPVPTNLSEKLVKTIEAFKTIGWLMPLVGIAEIIGGFFFIIPKTRALGAIVIFPIVLGIMLTNTITDTSGFPIAVVFFAINIWVLIENREKYFELIA